MYAVFESISTLTIDIFFVLSKWMSRNTAQSSSYRRIYTLHVFYDYLWVRLPYQKRMPFQSNEIFYQNLFQSAFINIPHLVEQMQLESFFVKLCQSCIICLNFCKNHIGEFNVRNYGDNHLFSTMYAPPLSVRKSL